MRPWLVWAIGVGLVAAAWVVVQITPDDDIAVEPFVVTAAVGEQADARRFAVTVTDTHLADTAVSGGWYGDGTWLVVDLEVTGLGTERNALGAGGALIVAEYVVDGVSYRASERPTSIFRSRPHVDLSRVGSVAFELPAALAESEGTLRLSGSDDTRLDAVVEVPIDLGALDREAEVELIPEGWAGP
jgi:hypothetical protein